MGHSLDSIIEIVPGLTPYSEEIEKTLRYLDLKKRDSYLSVGIGMNQLPFAIATQGADVTGIDVDKQSLGYQSSLLTRFGPFLKQSGGSISLMELDIDKEDLSRFYGRFDCVECVNFNFREAPWELAQILLSFGKLHSQYFLSSFGGPTEENDKIVKAVAQEAKRRGRKSGIVAMNLFTSDRYSLNHGVVLRVD